MCLPPTGDLEADTEAIQAFYADITGKHSKESVLARVAPKSG